MVREDLSIKVLKYFQIGTKGFGGLGQPAAFDSAL
jgi:hypothetical protein